MERWKDGQTDGTDEIYIPLWHTSYVGGTIKGMISMRMLILSYTIQLFISNVCTNFSKP